MSKSLFQKVYIKKFISKRLYQNVYVKRVYIKVCKIFFRMKHCLYIYQDYQPQKLYLMDKISVNRPIFQKFYLQIIVVKPW